MGTITFEYPRIGGRREPKQPSEACWVSQISRRRTWATQLAEVR
jgi:hypothetical protein